jgi:hypothetical protein
VSQNIPLRLAILANRHVYAILFDLTHTVELAQHELDKLALAVLWHHRQSINHHERIEALVEADLELVFNIGKVDLTLVEFVVAAIGQI